MIKFRYMNEYEKHQKIVDAWIKYIELENLMENIIIPRPSSFVESPDIFIKENKLYFKSKEVLEYVETAKDNICLSFPIVYKPIRGKREIYPIFTINLKRYLEDIKEDEYGKYITLSDDPSDFKVSLSNFQKIFNFEDEELDEVITGEGLFTFLKSNFNIKAETYEDALNKFFEVVRKQAADAFKVEKDIYIAEINLESYIMNINLYHDLREVKDKFPSEGSPAYKYLFSFERSKNIDHKQLYYGVFYKFEPYKAQADVVRLLENENLIAVQGPPGTGKTVLIMNIIATQVVKRALSIINGEDFNNLTFVASTNNEAVNNVIEHCRRIEGKQNIIPFYFRGGNFDEIRSSIDKIDNVINKLQEEKFSEARYNTLKKKILSAYMELSKIKDDYDEYLNFRQELLSLLEAINNKINKLNSKILAVEKDIEKHKDVENFTLSDIEKAREYVNLILKDIEDVEKRLINRIFKFFRNRQIREILREFYERYGDIIVEKFNLSLPKSKSDVVSLQKKLDDIKEKKEKYNWLVRNRRNLQEDKAKFIYKKEKIRNILKSLEEIIECLEKNLYEYHKKYHKKNLELFNLSLQFLWEHAKYMKDNVIRSLEIYRGYLHKLVERSKEEENDLNMYKKRLREYDLFHNISLVFPVIASTLHSVRNMIPFVEEGVIDLSIIDECAMTPCHQAYPLIFRSNKVVALGDPLQLEPVVVLKNNRHLENRYKKESFVNNGLNEEDFEIYSPTRATVYHRVAGCRESFYDDIGGGIILNEHRRCHKIIAELFRKIAKYRDLKIKTEENPDNEINKIIKEKFNNIRLIAYHVVDYDHRYDRYKNKSEAEVIMEIIDRLLMCGFKEEDIGIIAPYRRQVAYINSLLRARFRDRENKKIPITCGTVHAFQGKEKEVIIFSSVIRDPSQSRFINEKPNLLNVAVSRAKSLFILVGNIFALKNAGGYLEMLVKEIEDKGVIIEVEYNNSNKHFDIKEYLRKYDETEIITDCMHVEVFEEALKLAEKELIVVSPWIRGYGAERLMREIDNLLRKGVNVKVLYYYSRNMSEDEDIENDKRILKILKKKLKNNLIKVDPGTHEKALICDDKFAVTGSWNWLSVAGYLCCIRGLKNCRRELSVKIANKKFINELKEKLFRNINLF